MKHLAIVILLASIAAHATSHIEIDDDLGHEATIPLPIDDKTVVSRDTASEKRKIKTWGVIYPGTKWCGKGNKAKHDSDYGRFKNTDRCCRNHDRCPEKIKGRTTKYGIQNNGSVTILSCRCDDAFFDCLKGDRTRASKIVGTLYFDIVKNKCFKPLEENSEEFVMVKSRKFSGNKFIRFIGKMFG